MSYVDWFFYPVRAGDTHEYVRPAYKDFPDAERWSYYNADIAVNCSRLGPLVEQALRGYGSRATWLAEDGGDDSDGRR